MIFVDTNYFLRFLLADQKDQHQTAKLLFLSGSQGQVELFTSLVVFFEIYWVLSSFYKQKKSLIVDTLTKILGLKFIKFESKDLLVKSLKIFSKSKLDLEDSFNLMFAKTHKANVLATFDSELQKEFTHVPK